MSFFSPDRMCGFMFVSYCIAYGIRLNFIRQVKTRMDDFGVCDLYFRKRSLKRGSSIPLFFVHLLYYIFLLVFPFLFLIPFVKKYDFNFGFVLLIFYSAEFMIEKMFFLLERHVKYEALLFSIIHQVNCKLKKNVSDKEKIELVKNEIPWRNRYIHEVEKILDEKNKETYPWL